MGGSGQPGGPGRQHGGWSGGYDKCAFSDSTSSPGHWPSARPEPTRRLAAGRASSPRPCSRPRRLDAAVAHGEQALGLNEGVVPGGAGGQNGLGVVVPSSDGVISVCGRAGGRGGLPAREAALSLCAVAVAVVGVVPPRSPGASARWSQPPARPPSRTGRTWLGRWPKTAAMAAPVVGALVVGHMVIHGVRARDAAQNRRSVVWTFLLAGAS